MNILKSFIWSGIEKFSVQGVQFLISIIIARLVKPEEYGLIAMLAIFMSLGQIFVDSGFSNSLIQKKNRTETDFSTVFFFNIFIAIIIYLILYISAPVIADFYNEEVLVIITRWIGLNIIISSFSIVQRTKLIINLDFKTMAKVSLLSTLLSGVIGIIMAYKGYGVWALLFQSIAASLLNTILLNCFLRWHPLFVFSYSSFIVLFSFGYKLLLSSLLHSIYYNLYSLVIGKRFTSLELAYYSRSNSMVQYLSPNIVVIMNRTVYPILCQLQDDRPALENSFFKYLRLGCFITVPMMFMFATLSKPIVLILLTEKWADISLYITILSLSYSFYPISQNLWQILNVVGRSDLAFKAEIIKKIVAVVILLMTIMFNLEIICWGIFVYNLLDILIISFYVKRVFGFGLTKIINNVYPIYKISFLASLIVYLIVAIIENTFLKIFVGILVAILLLITLSQIYKIQEFIDFKSTIKNKLWK